MQSIPTAAPAASALAHQRKTVAGCWPVMLTPFDDNKRIDWRAYGHLIDWYVAAGSQGLFAACLSSEIFQLTAVERLELARRAVALSAGRVPVIASGALGNTPSEIADAANRLADTGVQAVIFLSNQFGEETDGDDVWLANIEATIARVRPDVRLGIYECPIPYKRLLSPRVIRWAADTGRFHFTKDTCCDLAQIKAKLAAMSGSPLRFYNAHCGTLLSSMQAGGHGFSGVGANAVPHLYAWLCRHHEEQPDLARELQTFLIESSPAVDRRYPHSVKAWLRLNGLPVFPVARLSENNLDENDMQRLRAFRISVAGWENRLGLTSPFSKIG